MFSTDFIFRQQENLVDNQKSQAECRPLRNKILFDDYKVIAWIASSKSSDQKLFARNRCSQLRRAVHIKPDL